MQHAQKSNVDPTSAEELLLSLLRIEGLLRELVAQQSGGSHREQRPLCAADRKAMAVSLPAVHAAVGDAVWTLVDIEKDAPAAFAALQRAAGNASRRSLGRLLARVAASGAAVDGLRLEQVGQAREGALWRIATRVRV